MAKKLTTQVTANLVRPPVQTGSGNVGVNPGHVGQIGGMVGDHTTEHGGWLRKSVEPAEVMARPSQDLGNKLATNVGAGGPGTGRTVYATGVQGIHGPVNRGSPPPKRDLFPGWERQR